MTKAGLEYAQARYYNPTHGRFTSVDPLTASATVRNPQTFNRYAYVINDPLDLTDPNGLEAADPSSFSACSAEYSYEQCGGDSGFWGGGRFGDRVAYDKQTLGDMSAGLRKTIDAYLQRISNSQAGYGFVSNAEVSETLAAAYWIWYGYDANGTLWTQFNLNATFQYSELSEPPGGLNDNARALIQDLGRRRGPVLQKITNTMGAGALIIIAAPLAADAILAGASTSAITAPSSGITFGHGARHLVLKGLSKWVVENVIRNEIIAISQGATETGVFWGKIIISGQTILYRAFTLPNGNINVGTYFPLQ